MEDRALLEELVLELGLEIDLVETIWFRENTLIMDGTIYDLDLSDLGITFIPDLIDQFTELRRLDLSRNNIVEFTPNLLDLTHIELIDLRDNSFIELPISLEPIFEVIRVESNKIPRGDERGNEITFSPQPRVPFSNYVHFEGTDDYVILEEIILEWGLDYDMVDEILQRTHTVVEGTTILSLDLSGLGITYIPDLISQFLRLQYLSLADNEIVDFTPHLLDISQLQQLDLSGNPFPRVPSSLEPIFDKIIVERRKLPVADRRTGPTTVTAFQQSTKQQRYYVRVSSEKERQRVLVLLEATRDRRCCKLTARFHDRFCSLCGRSIPSEWHPEKQPIESEITTNQRLSTHKPESNSNVSLPDIEEDITTIESKNSITSDLSSVKVEEDPDITVESESEEIKSDEIEDNMASDIDLPLPPQNNQVGEEKKDKSKQKSAETA